MATPHSKSGKVWMGGDVASLAAEMTPYVSAAVGVYGGAVLAKCAIMRPMRRWV